MKCCKQMTWFIALLVMVLLPCGFCEEQIDYADQAANNHASYKNEFDDLEPDAGSFAENNTVETMEEAEKTVSLSDAQEDSGTGAPERSDSDLETETETIVSAPLQSEEQATDNQEIGQHNNCTLETTGSLVQEALESSTSLTENNQFESSQTVSMDAEALYEWEHDSANAETSMDEKEIYDLINIQAAWPAENMEDEHVECISEDNIVPDTMNLSEEGNCAYSDVTKAMIPSDMQSIPIEKERSGEIQTSAESEHNEEASCPEEQAMKACTYDLADLLSSVEITSGASSLDQGNWREKENAEVSLVFHFETTESMGFAQGILEYRIPECIHPVSGENGYKGGTAKSNAGTFSYIIDRDCILKVNLAEYQTEILYITLTVHGVWKSRDSGIIPFGNGVRKKIDVLYETDIPIQSENNSEDVPEFFNDKVVEIHPPIENEHEEEETIPMDFQEGIISEHEVNKKGQPSDSSMNDAMNQQDLASSPSPGSTIKEETSAKMLVTPADSEEVQDDMLDAVSINDLIYVNEETNEEKTAEDLNSNRKEETQMFDPGTIKDADVNDIVTELDMDETEKRMYRELFAEIEGGSADTVIRVSGCLPEGLCVKAFPVDIDIPGETLLAAFDILIIDGNGNEYHPSEDSVSVSIMTTTIQDALLDPDNHVSLYHLTTSDIKEIQPVFWKENAGHEITFDLVYP